MTTEKEKIRDVIVQNNLERAKYYWENPNIPMSINVVTQLLKDNFNASFKAGKVEAINELLEDINNGISWKQLEKELNAKIRELAK